jgi:hypothetical protein
MSSSGVERLAVMLAVDTQVKALSEYLRKAGSW